MPSLEGVLAGIPGYGGYLAARQQNEQQQMQNLQQAGLLVGLQKHLQEQDQAAQLRSALAQSGGDTEKALEVALKTGNISAAHALAPLVKLAQEKKQHEQTRQAMTDLNAATVPATVQPAGPQELGIDQPAGGADSTAAVGTEITAQRDIRIAKLNKLAEVYANNPAAVTRIQAEIDRLQNIKPMVEHNFSVGENMVQPHISMDQGKTWQPIPGSQPSAKFARQLTPETDAYANVQPDGKGGFIGLNKKTGRMEPIPMAPGTPAPGFMDKEGIAVAAWDALLFGKNPPGMGNASAMQRAQVANERARIGKELGLSPMEMAMLPQDNKIKMKAVDTLTKWGATVGRSAEKLELDLGVAIDYAKKLPLGQVQLINQGVIRGLKEFNSPDANAYAAALNSARQEYARLMTGPTSNAMLPVEAMKKGNELLSSGVDVPSLTEVKTQMLRDAANTITATNHQIEGLRGSIQGLGKLPSFSERQPPPTSPAPAAVYQEGQTATGPTGQKIIFKGGQWQPIQ